MVSPGADRRYAPSSDATEAYISKLENVAIANALQLQVAQPIHRRIIALRLLIHYFTIWPWPLTFNREHLQCMRIACDVMKLCTKFERGGITAITVFDLMTLNMF